MGYTVGDLAKLAHVTVRTLHHYDELGLLKPSGRSKASYRLYTEADLARLQQILFFRELGFALEDVARILQNPEFDRRKALVAQRALLVEKLGHLEAAVALVDKTLDSLERGTRMKPEEMFEVFGDFDPGAHEVEAKARWGESTSYAESTRRTKRYTKEDWKTIRDEAEAIGRAFGDALASGKAPADLRVMDVAERARLHIDRWFYPCSRDMHRALGQIYVDDPRFAANYEKIRAGLAAFVRDAIRANSARP
jgi:MerR family transcriptional regulator, thiopeptide resistance regulator